MRMAIMMNVHCKVMMVNDDYNDDYMTMLIVVMTMRLLTLIMIL
jgi:hypothetical protein